MRFSAAYKPFLPEIHDAKNFIAQAHGRVFGYADRLVGARNRAIAPCAWVAVSV